MKLLLLPAAALAATLAFGPGVAHANGNAPAGNNGTIKIDGVPAEDGNDNKPHPGCQFTVEFFGYDAGERTATLEFEAQAPTDGAKTREPETARALLETLDLREVTVTADALHTVKATAELIPCFFKSLNPKFLL